MKTIFIVTGIYGHLGSTIAKMLLDDGQIVRGLALPNDTTDSLKNYTNLQVFRGDICNKASLEPLFGNTCGARVVVIHTAGLISIATHPTQLLRQVNVRGTQNIIELCRRYAVSKLLYVSSVHAIPEASRCTPICEVKNFDSALVMGAYAKTKAEATRRVLLAAANGLNAVVVHPSGIIGPGDYGHGHLTQLILDCLDGRLKAIVQGAYDFVDVRDVATGCLMALQSGKAGECFILSGSRHTIPELINSLCRITGISPVKTVLPMWFARATAPLSEKYYKVLNQPPLYTSYSLYTLSSNSVFLHEKATRQLGYCPRNINETLRDTAQWLYSAGRTHVKLNFLENVK